MEDQSDVFAFLASPETHGLSEPVRRIDTHGACVFLAGRDAYKVKRAVRFPFLDFSTLEKRQRACENEMVVNRENAPGLYLGVVPVTRGQNGLAIGGEGEVVEWAVHLRRFDETQTLDRLADAEGLPPPLIAKLAARILASHGRAPVHSGTAAVAAFERQARETLDELDDGADVFTDAALGTLRAAVEDELEALQPLLLRRGDLGQIRRCHGDLHLRNVVLLEGEPVLFDAIEFNDAIATCDVLFDLAFMLMDLGHRGFLAEANLLLNRYLWGAEQEELQIEGLRALPLFMALRAAIRAKVSLDLAHLSSAAAETAIAEGRRYLDLALRLVGMRSPPALIAVGGLSGSGKSTLAARLCPVLGDMPGAVHVRSDIERKRLFGSTEFERLPPSAYDAPATQRTYERVRELARLALRARCSVVVDAVHARLDEREAIAAVAGKEGVPFHGLWLDGAVATLRDRVARRVHDASDATAEVVDLQAGFDIGPLSWPRLDATRPLEEVAEQALETIALGMK
ncbi:AAA family ATPase [Aquabacter sp. CN5-332]|uniref:bifunctional aminoglycoside phosphotransferase/ATP-binding protein n=1 Tax=Aquabacter sp. CN5-332 TaxID=3156608 RepID=UPI0032B3173E